MKLYISGPMSGKPMFNIPAFDRMARKLRERGHDVVSPAELDSAEFRLLCLKSKDGDIEQLKVDAIAAGLEPETWGDLLARDVKLLADDGIEGIVVLEGWGKSRGAALETFTARLANIPILAFWSDDTLKPVEKWVVEDVHARACERPSLNIKPPVARYVPDLGVEPPRIEDVMKDFQDFPPLHGPEGFGSPVNWEPHVHETRVVDPKTGGEKGAKQAVLGDLDPRALMEVAKVAGFGRGKYSRFNFAKGYDWSLSYDACQRHLHQFWNREELDSETGLHHLAAAAWHCLTLLCFVLRERGNDDRMI